MEHINEENLFKILVDNPNLSYTKLSNKYGVAVPILRNIAKDYDIEWLRYPIRKRGIQHWDYTVDYNTGCWNWNHGVYGKSQSPMLYIANDKKISALRYAWEFHYKTKLGKGSRIYQKCGNNKCINLSHLIISNEK